LTNCNDEAKTKNLAGDARKSFMSDCLKAKPAVAEKKMTPQQEKMGACNKQASDQKLAGDKRKTFMSSCLKG
jgi:hypothetical protein